MRAALLSLIRRFGPADPFAPPLSGRGALVLLPHLAALAAMAATEAGPRAVAAFLLSWAILNFFWLALLRRPAVAGLFSLTMLAALILLSQLKYRVLMMTANFVDVMIIDKDTIAFLLTIFPALRWIVMLGTLMLVPFVAFVWRRDLFRVRRLVAAPMVVGCIGCLTLLEFQYPLEPSHAFFGGNEVSSFARSGVDAISTLLSHGLMEFDPVADEHLAPEAGFVCRPAKKPPHIILIHDESSFDIRMAPGIRVPSGYGAHFRSFDDKERNFLVEGNGGPSWFTEYNVLDGLAARSFGDFDYFVTRIAAGRVKRGLPAALDRCGYRTYSLYPALGDFMSERSFQATAGVQHFYDKRALGAHGVEPDSFFYAAATRLFAEGHARGPMFVFVYLAANHFPWDFRYRPDLMPQWKDPGNVAPVDEYLRRQAISAEQYSDFLARLRHDFPDDSFLLVRFGDHQPDFAAHLVESGLDDDAIEGRLEDYDPRYYTTYYAIDAINFTPADVSSALETLEGPYLPLVVQEAAGLPLGPSFAEQKKILLRCGGLFYGCAEGAEARRFNRMLIDAGLIKNL